MMNDRHKDTFHWGYNVMQCIFQVIKRQEKSDMVKKNTKVETVLMDDAALISNRFRTLKVNDFFHLFF